MYVSRSFSPRTATIVLTFTCAATASAAFPGENGRIAFYRDGDVWSVEADGSDETNLTQNPALDADQRWSADGTRIVFTSDREGNRDVWVMDADGGNPTQITTHPADDLQPSWSPDGTKILFMTERDGDREIYVVNADGTNPVNLTNSPGTDDDDEAHWSPDGSTISFYRSGDVWLMDADGSNQRNATNAPGSADFDQNWSPDGTKMVFDSDRDGDREIFVMDADGSNQVQLTFNGNRDRQPVFSPDGTKILFESDRDGPDQLYVMDVDGQNQQRLVESSTDDQEPDWQPIVTLPLGTPVAGKKLLLKDNAAKPQRRALKLIAKDPGIGTGAENGGPGDPTLHGGFLKIVSASGDGFNATYDLPAASWRTKGKPGKNKGYKLKKAGPVRKVLVKLGKSLKVVARGDALGHTLGADPTPVHVALGLGSRVYCLTFGGTTQFKAGKSFQATGALPPDECAALLPACGDGLAEAGDSCPLLEGPADGLAIDATFDYENLDPVPPSAIGPDVDGDPVVRTRLQIVFPDDATVGAVNAAIDGVGGRIVSMVGGVPGVVIEIPDPGSAAALDAIVTSLEAQPGVTWALPSLLSEPDVVPGNFHPIETADLSRIDHQLAIRAHAAWNARGALQSSFLGVVVFDFFGDGVPDAAFDVNVPQAADFSTGTADARGTHGYHVLGIISAAFGGDGSGRGQATGLVPDTLQVRVVDSLDASLGGAAAEENRLLMILKSGPGPRILNTSRGYSSDCGRPAAKLNKWAVSWTKRIRMLGLEDRVLHLTSAGNINATCPMLHEPTRSSDWAVAAMGAMTDASGTPVPNLTDVLVVENAANTASEPYEPSCLSKDSYYPGQIGGIGEQVWSLTAADATGIGGAATAGNKGGTSMATPQVAGLAAYLWRLDPALTVAELRGLLLATARPAMGADTIFTCAGVAGQPVIDAYGAVLALDEATLPTPASAPIRFALLDVDDDGDFDGIDLFEWTTILLDAGTGELQEPVVPAYDRYDLNGDGYTGGRDRTAPFDLDRVGSARYGASQLEVVLQTVEGTQVAFDEHALNDLEILCYYAYSDLFTGSSVERASLLGSEHCSPIVLNVDFPGGVLLEGQSATLTVALGTNDPGGSQPLAGETIQLLPTGATANPPGGLTDAQGMFSSSITAGGGVTSLQVVVRAVSTADGTPLGEQTVTAQVQPNVPGTVAWRTSTCIFSQYVGGQLTSTNVLNTCDQGIVGDRHALPYVDSGTCTGSIAQPNVGSVDASSTGTIDSDWLTDTGGTRVGARLAGHSSPMVELVVMQPGNVPPCGGATGRIFCSVQFDVQSGVVPYAITYETSGSVSGAGETRLLVSLGGQADSVGSVVLVNTEIGVDDRMGTLLPGTYGFTIESRVDVGMCDASVTASGMASVTAQLVLGTSTPTTTMMITTTTSTTSSTSTTTTTSTSSSTTSVSATTTTSSTTSTSTTLFAVPVVPYARYVATGPDGPVVMLADEFGTESVDLGAVGFELPPVTIDGLLPPDPDTHQTCWTHPGGPLDTCIDIQDQFGLAPLRVGGPVTVCVPELSPAVAVDAFKCYQATGTPLEQPVALEDEFQTQAVVVGAPELLCTPVEVDGNPITNAGRYLVCYATTPAGTAGGPISVENALSGGPIQVDVGTATGVCVPALRQLVATCQLCGNGVPEGDEECDDGNVVAGDGCSPVCRIEP